MQLSGKKQSGQTERTLADLRARETATVDCLDLPEDLANRLMELGFIPGHPVEAVRRAPGGDPRVFRVDGAEIALRRETAQHIYLRNS
jgi:ferrous iron transport protein A